jgi:hypothetical protein
VVALTTAQWAAMASDDVVALANRAVGGDGGR